MRRRGTRQHGFTLMELIIVIVIAGILSTMTVSFITLPMEGYLDLSRRAELVDHAEMSMRQMARDVRRALPNSLRVIDGGSGIEMILVAGGGRYESDPTRNAHCDSDALTFSEPEDCFVAYGGNLPDDVTGRLVVYNLGVDGANAHNGDEVMTPTGTIVTIGAPDADSAQRVSLSPGHQFPFDSPSRRIYLVDRVVRYSCSGDGLMRSERSIMDSSYSAPVPVARKLDCNASGFSYDSGTAMRSALTTITLSLIDSGERVSLLHQVHVDNLP